ncbi:uncharacterized protein LOC110932502 [Helianthus annuus]|uniref:uncharacterized protein LOC110932502 n=1 Tax=Helianthus annuus TaxID=4232 RepID=UPI000B9041EB|nr:uncharacterized protein LOC110932502 [Helianthus annuus]
MPLKERFPLLFRLETEKKVVIDDRFNSLVQTFSRKWRWSRSPASPDELREWSDFISLLDSAKLSDNQDKWEWSGRNDKEFSVGAVKRFLRSDEDYKIRRLLHLSKQNSFSGDERCVMCSDGSESAEHLFCYCEVAAAVWYHTSRWCHISSIYAFSLNDMLEVNERAGLGVKAKDILKGIIMVGWWCIWKARNERRFSKRQRSVANIVQDIKSLGYYGIVIDQKIDMFLGIIGFLFL